MCSMCMCAQAEDTETVGLCVAFDCTQQLFLVMVVWGKGGGGIQKYKVKGRFNNPRAYYYPSTGSQ